MQDRVKGIDGKSKYKTDEDGEIVLGQSKKGVPLSDVWEIPYLNPKARERVGYPTQKPIILLEQIIKLVTDPNDIVLDPFSGSGTTLIAAKMLQRRYIGIDISDQAVALAEERLNTLGATPVQRNSGIDGFLNKYIDNRPVSIKIQKPEETLDEAVNKLIKSSKSKKCDYMILIRTHIDIMNLFDFDNIPTGLILLDSYDLQLEKLL